MWEYLRADSFDTSSAIETVPITQSSSTAIMSLLITRSPSFVIESALIIESSTTTKGSVLIIHTAQSNRVCANCSTYIMFTGLGANYSTSAKQV